MSSAKRSLLLPIAAVNLLVAVVLLVEFWGFYHGLDRSGVLLRIDHNHKNTMLRHIHYWGIPPLALLTLTSGVWFWRLSREEKD